MEPTPQLTLRFFRVKDGYRVQIIGEFSRVLDTIHVKDHSMLKALLEATNAVMEIL